MWWSEVLILLEAAVNFLLDEGTREKNRILQSPMEKKTKPLTTGITAVPQSLSVFVFMIQLCPVKHRDQFPYSFVLQLFFLIFLCEHRNICKTEITSLLMDCF